MKPKGSAASHVIVLIDGIPGVGMSAIGTIASQALKDRNDTFVPVITGGSFNPDRAITTLRSLAKEYGQVTFVGDILLGAALAHDTIARMQRPSSDPLPAFRLILVDSSIHVAAEGRSLKTRQQRYVNGHSDPDPRVLNNVRVVLVQSPRFVSNACARWQQASRNLSTIPLETKKLDDPTYLGRIIAQGINN